MNKYRFGLFLLNHSTKKLFSYDRSLKSTVWKNIPEYFILCIFYPPNNTINFKTTTYWGLLFLGMILALVIFLIDYVIASNQFTNCITTVNFIVIKFWHSYTIPHSNIHNRVLQFPFIRQFIVFPRELLGQSVSWAVSQINSRNLLTP